MYFLFFFYFSLKFYTEVTIFCFFSQGALLPGYKIMIIGPVTCRRGIILLEDGKYREVGGEVESLLKLNALENVLARAL